MVEIIENKLHLAIVDDIKIESEKREEVKEDFDSVKSVLKGKNARQKCNDCISALWCGTLCLSCINNLFICCAFVNELQ